MKSKDFWQGRDKYLHTISKINHVYSRLLKAGRGLEKHPKNIGDMFYRNYLEAECKILFKELLGSRRFSRSKRYQLNKKGRRKYGNTLTLGGELLHQYRSLTMDFNNV